MPYIKKEVRDIIDSQKLLPHFPGELNYKISSIIDQYIEDCSLSYTVLNEVIGVLECIKLEIYRRIVAPYEDNKLHDNGEVYRHAVKSIQPSLFDVAQKAVIEIVPTSGAKYGETKFGE